MDESPAVAGRKALVPNCCEPQVEPPPPFGLDGCQQGLEAGRHEMAVLRPRSEGSTGAETPVGHPAIVCLSVQVVQIGPPASAPIIDNERLQMWLHNPAASTICSRLSQVYF